MSITKETQLESFDQISLVADIRKRVIVDVLIECGELTAQELATILHKRGFISSDERNFTAPRLTELRIAGEVEAVDKKYCDKTGRKVTVWAIRDSKANGQ